MTDILEQDRQRYRAMMKDDPETFLRELEKSGSVMFGPMLEVVAEHLREAWSMPKSKPKRRRRR